MSTKILARSVRTVRVFLTLFLLFNVFAPSFTVKAAVWCQCVQYIKNRFQLSGAIGLSGGAKDMGQYLAARGFAQLWVPSVGAVMIMKPAFGGVDATYGHVGLIVDVIDRGDKWQVTLRGSNQPGTTWTEYDCTNVSNWVRLYPKTYGADKVEYWSRNFALGRPVSVTSIEKAGLEGPRGNDGRVNTRWSSRITSSSTTVEYYIVNLQNTRTFDRVVINWEAAYAARHFVGWSMDGKNFSGYWYSIPRAGNYAYLIGLRSARYVIVFMDRKAPGLGNYSFWELRVFNGTAPAVQSLPTLNRNLSTINIGSSTSR
jgi:hypothetical protein